MEKINFENIVDNLDTAVIAVDYDNKIIWANHRFCVLYMTNCTKLKKHSIYDFLPEHTDTVTIKDNLYKISKLDDKDCSYFYLTNVDNQLEKIYSEFISTVSHELRTPLTSIRGFADTILTSFEKLDSEQLKRFLSIIKDQSNRLIKLVENLLSISKIQVQQQNFVYKSINPKSQIEQIIDIVKTQHPSNIFELKTNNNVQNILADENKFQQILINLMDNAAKYSYPKGLIKITLENSSCKENFVSIKITDHGVGIETKDQLKIFEKFAKIKNHLTRKTEGSGLGLYIVKNLVEKMGGKISVKSSTEPPNNGTTFEVLLPAVSYTNQSQKRLEDK